MTLNLYAPPLQDGDAIHDLEPRGGVWSLE